MCIVTCTQFKFLNDIGGYINMERGKEPQKQSEAVGTNTTPKRKGRRRKKKDRIVVENPLSN